MYIAIPCLEVSLHLLQSILRVTSVNIVDAGRNSVDDDYAVPGNR
jgi:hypothetical protein